MGNYTRMPTKEEAKKIAENAFIDIYDPTKYDVKDFKCIIIFGSGLGLDGLIDGLPREGMCLFIPYLDDEMKNVNCRSVSHIGYLYYALKKYRFGTGESALTNTLNTDITSFTISDEILVPLLTLGHAVFYDVRYDELFPSTIFISPQGITDTQNQLLKRIAKVLGNNDYRFGIQYLSNGKLTKYGDELEYDDFLHIIDQLNNANIDQEMVDTI